MNPNPHADYRRQAETHFSDSASQAPPNVTVGARASAMSAYEHQNIALLPGEDAIFAADFTASPLLRHIKTGLVVTRERVVVRYPQYMFLVLKVGHAESSVPIRHVCSMTSGRQLSQRRVMWAAIAGFAGFFFFTSSLSMLSAGPLGAIFLLMAIGLLAFAAFQAWLARGLALIVTHGGGGSLRVDVEKAEYDTMLDADHLIQKLVTEVARTAVMSPPANPASDHAGPPPVQPTTNAAAQPTTPPPASQSYAQPHAARAMPPRAQPPQSQPSPQRPGDRPSIWRA